MKMFLGVFLGVLTTATAATVTLNPVADTSLFQNNANNNLGGMTFFPVGNTLITGGQDARGLVKFNLSGIPAGSTITSAQLELNIEGSGPQSVNLAVTIHRSLVEWFEGTGTGQASGLGRTAAPGETSWNRRIAPGTSWGAAGGQAGVDYVTTSSANLTLPQVGSVNASGAGILADVQQWVNSPGTNFGWFLIPAQVGANRKVTSKEGTTKPRLVVTYEEPVVEPTEPTITNPQLVGNNFQFSFQAEAPFVYTVESRASLANGDWETLTNFTAQATTTAVISDIVTGDARFYRVSVSAQ